MWHLLRPPMSPPAMRHLPGELSRARGRRERDVSVPQICIHALRPLRDDIRAQRTAMALAEAGFAISIIDIAHGHGVSREETLGDIAAKSMISRDGIRAAESSVRHIIMPEWLVPYYNPTNYVGWALFKCWRMICAAAQLMRTPADIYHASDIAAFPACYLAARFHRKPLVFETYEMPLEEPAITRRRRLYALAGRILTAMIPACAGVIATSPLHAEAMESRYGSANVVLVRNIPAYEQPRASDRLRQRLGLHESTRIALYQGNLQANRGLDALVRAARFLAPDIVIVMLGRGESRAELERLIAEEDVGDRVRILPAVPFAELLEWTASADIGLTIFDPNYSLHIRTCLPNKLFEYLMAGLPVLTSPLEAVVEVINRYDVGRVLASLAPEALALAIGQMLADHAGLRRMRANALAAAERELCWEMEQEKLIGLYEDILRAHVQQPNRPQVRACT